MLAHSSFISVLLLAEFYKGKRQDCSRLTFKNKINWKLFQFFQFWKFLNFVQQLMLLFCGLLNRTALHNFDYVLTVRPSTSHTDIVTGQDACLCFHNGLNILLIVGGRLLSTSSPENAWFPWTRQHICVECSTYRPKFHSLHVANLECTCSMFCAYAQWCQEALGPLKAWGPIYKCWACGIDVQRSRCVWRATWHHLITFPHV